MKRLFALLLAVALVLGCAPALAEGTDANTLVIDGAPATQFSYTFNNIGGLPGILLFNALLRSNATLDGVTPDLCTEYTVSEDMLTYTFTIREGVTWHDGQPFTPEDVKFNLQFIPKLSVINSIYTNAVKAIEGAEAYVAGEAAEISGITIDGSVVTVKLSRVYGSFLNVIAQWMMLPKHLLETADPLNAHTDAFWQNPVGTGPYKVAEVEWGNYAILARNEEYFGEKPQIERVKMITVADQIVACQAGEIDYFNTNNPDIISEVSKLPDYTVYPVDTYFMRYFIFNIEDPDGNKTPMADIRVRQAILHAIDRQSVVDSLFSNGELTDTFVPAGYADYLTGATHYDYNPDKAKELLAEAGWNPDYELRIRYYYSDQLTLDLMDLIVYYLGEVGIKANHAFLDGDPTALIYQTRDHDMVYKGLSAFGYEEAYGEMTSSGNIMTYLVQGDEFDGLYGLLTETTDLAARGEIVKQLQALDQETLYRLPFYSLQNCVVVKTSKLRTAEVYGNEWWNYDRALATWSIIGK